MYVVHFLYSKIRKILGFKLKITSEQTSYQDFHIEN